MAASGPSSFHATAARIAAIASDTTRAAAISQTVISAATAVEDPRLRAWISRRRSSSAIAASWRVIAHDTSRCAARIISTSSCSVKAPTSQASTRHANPAPGREPKPGVWSSGISQQGVGALSTVIETTSAEDSASNILSNGGDNGSPHVTLF